MTWKTTTLSSIKFEKPIKKILFWLDCEHPTEQPTVTGNGNSTVPRSVMNGRGVKRLKDAGLILNLSCAAIYNCDGFVLSTDLPFNAWFDMSRHVQ